MSNIKTIHGKVRKGKLKDGINEFIDKHISEGQRVLCHTSKSSLSERLIIIHDGIRLTINIQEGAK